MRRLIFTATLLLASWHSPEGRAAGFAALVSPPRFELTAKSGATLRQVFEVTNGSNTPGRLRVHTADFVLGADFGVTFHDELTPGSCRPWVAIERPLVSLAGRYSTSKEPDAEVWLMGHNGLHAEIRVDRIGRQERRYRRRFGRESLPTRSASECKATGRPSNIFRLSFGNGKRDCCGGFPATC